ncbi:MAG: hypothetical protein J1F11_06175 [Oscillospiraceae bacterium]|nr:hypothetical protein [Oscillospiraceae bacterium]
MKNNIDIDWNNPVRRFQKHFGYYCQLPLTAEIDSMGDFQKFSDLVDKCIADNFDYTIEVCGTRPPAYEGLPEIIID